jgi:sulfate/thiosulfate transport system ATP-binding protein
LTKHFGGNAEVTAASDVSFEAPSDRVTVLLGPSGSGKSTLLRFIAGLEQPDGGSVSIDGKDVTRVPTSELYPRGTFAEVAPGQANLAGSPA